jgi:cell fate (sporulation/competence/biofilm development) regulator YlbF (YheA/YmcA/DUF963 family)
MWISKKKYKAEIEKAERRGAEKYRPYYKACKRLEQYVDAEQKREKIVQFMEARENA